MPFGVFACNMSRLFSILYHPNTKQNHLGSADVILLHKAHINAHSNKKPFKNMFNLDKVIHVYFTLFQVI